MWPHPPPGFPREPHSPIGRPAWCWGTQGKVLTRISSRMMSTHQGPQGAKVRLSLAWKPPSLGGKDGMMLTGVVGRQAALDGLANRYQTMAKNGSRQSGSRAVLVPACSDGATEQATSAARGLSQQNIAMHVAGPASRQAPCASGQTDRSPISSFASCCFQGGGSARLALVPPQRNTDRVWPVLCPWFLETPVTE
jgi:hypothetical protein